MRILFDQGVHEMRNIGNIAMTEVAVKRIKDLWPDATLEILTIAPRLSKVYFPDLCPVSPNGPPFQGPNRNRLDYLLQRVPRPVLLFFFATREKLWNRWPDSKFRSFLHRSQSGFETNKEQMDSKPVSSKENDSIVKNEKTNIDVIQGIDLLVTTGGQFIADVVKNEGFRVLGRLETAVKVGIPTAMVGLGIGPVDDEELWSRASDVFPLVDLILIREGLEAPRLLNSFGVDPRRVILTGDDAIELAYQARTNSYRNGIGVGLRVSYYSEIGEIYFEPLLQVLNQAAEMYNAPFYALPISQTALEEDERFIRQLINGPYPPRHSEWRFHTPLEIIKRVGRCRIVVTGAFHAAVFALAQGIPAICLAKSDHYMNKFLGLAGQFGEGCKVVSLENERLQETLTDLIGYTWESAEDFRPGLLEAAKHQIEMGQTAYKQLYSIVELKKKALPV